MCRYCEDETVIFEEEVLDDLLITWCDSSITRENADYTKKAVFIDRGYLRLVNSDDCQCLDHGQKVRIAFCPFCGAKL